MTIEKARAAKQKSRASVVLVFGEDEHDRSAIKKLTEGLRRDLAGKVETRRKPLVLIKNASLEKARRNAAEIASLVRQELTARDVLAVLAHADCDDTEPAHVVAAKRIEDDLAAVKCPVPAIGVTPAWEIEAWWMIFPEAVGRVVEGWRDPDDWLGKDVGQVRNAKENLAHAVKPRQKTKKPPRDYQEHDSIAIAANIVEGALLASFQSGQRTSYTTRGAPRYTRSASFEAFRAKVMQIPGPRPAGQR